MALNSLRYTPTAGWQLGPLSEAGLLKESRHEPFRPWRSYRRQLGDLSFKSSEFLYSRYQLLVNSQDVTDITRRMTARRDTSGSLRYRLRLRPWDEASQNADDRLVVMLCALEARYRPAIVGRLVLSEGSRESWDQFDQDFDPAAMLAWLGMTAPQILETGERLLWAADFKDPLGDWWNLIRFGRRDRWDLLKGAALLALEHRIAAEMFLRFHDDLVGSGVATAPEPPEPGYQDARHARIPRSEGGLEEAVTEFGLSTHPAVVLVLEGETEMRLVPQALDLFLPEWRHRMRLVNARGVDTNLGLLAAYAGALGLGRDHGDFVLLTRPFTRIVVVFDPEGSFATEAVRETKRTVWATRIQESLPEPYLGSSLVRSQLRDLVEVQTWGSSFEFAHFTNRQIAAAANRVARRVNPTAPPFAASSVAKLREHRGNLDKLWERRSYRGLTKPAVAMELWPILERKLEIANEAGQIESVPLGRVLLRVDELINLPRHSWALETSESPSGCR